MNLKTNNTDDISYNNSDNSTNIINNGNNNDYNSIDNNSNSINIIDKRLFALELFLGSTYNSLDIQSSQLSIGNRESGSLAYPLIDTIAK